MTYKPYKYYQGVADAKEIDPTLKAALGSRDATAQLSQIQMLQAKGLLPNLNLITIDGSPVEGEGNQSIVLPELKAVKSLVKLLSGFFFARRRHKGIYIYYGMLMHT